MKSDGSATVHALEFGCLAPLIFYQRCSSCVRFSDGCPDLERGKEILHGGKKLVYTIDHSEDGIRASSFTCLAPLSYFEKSRSNCGHKGRCREEGLLLTLLSGRKQLTYTRKTAIQLPRRKPRAKEAVTPEIAEKTAE
jgi:hypothetical protein